jgi:hypothetical protein
MVQAGWSANCGLIVGMGKASGLAVELCVCVCVCVCVCMYVCVIVIFRVLEGLEGDSALCVYSHLRLLQNYCK